MTLREWYQQRIAVLKAQGRSYLQPGEEEYVAASVCFHMAAVHALCLAELDALDAPGLDALFGVPDGEGVRE